MSICYSISMFNKMHVIKILIVLLIAKIKCSSEYEECGKVNSDNDSFPWNVGIYLQNKNELELVCLGSLIKSKAILTAAHCVCDNISGKVRNNSFYITTGKLQKTIHLTNENIQKISKDNIIANKNYNGLINFYSDDLALLKLDNKIKFNKEIQPVCVDWGNSIRDESLSGKQSVWDGAKIQNIIQNYIDDDECSYSASKAFAPFITEDKFCTKSKHTLNLESIGSGLVFLNPQDNLWYIKGVTSSFDPEKGAEIMTMTKVWRYLNWMSNICAKL